MKRPLEPFHFETRLIIGQLKKQKLKEKIVILNYYRIAKAETCFINAMQIYNKIIERQPI